MTELDRFEPFNRGHSLDVEASANSPVCRKAQPSSSERRPERQASFENLKS
jgi:hypothetical protein